MNLKTLRKDLLSLDRSCGASSVFTQPDRYRQILSLPKSGNYIAQGAGVSYAPLSFGSSSTVVNLKNFNRILRFDPEALLIEVEAGISLGDLYSFLTPRKLYLPVQPGHPQITIGGCIACDVHGKNQSKEGNFRLHVESIVLFHPDYGSINASRNTNSEIFELTCGGFGLTGIVLSATLRLKSLLANSVDVSYIGVSSLNDAAKKLVAAGESADILYTFHDLSPFSSRKGKGFVIQGRFSELSNFNERNTGFLPLHIRNKPIIKFPIYNKVSGSIINLLYSFYHKQILRNHRISIFDFTFPIASKSFYYSMYGTNGFMEHQVLIPSAHVEKYLQEFLELIQKEKPEIYLASLKIFNGEQSFLRFDGKGISMTIDLPNKPESLGFLNLLDNLNAKHAAIVNIAKDSRLTRKIVESSYPEFEKFRSALSKFDPRRLFRSALSERLDI